MAAGCSGIYPVLHWWQGESDANSTGVVDYPSKFNKMYAYYSSIFGANFKMVIYEINSRPYKFDKTINDFFVDFASRAPNVEFVKMPSNTTYDNPPLNNHPSKAVIHQLLKDYFFIQTKVDYGQPWTGFPSDIVFESVGKAP